MNSITRCIALIAAGSLFSLGGCDSRNDSSAARGTPTTQADNTGSNWDDVGRDAKTPMDQSQASEHVKLTADIRQAIISDDTLPIGAKNCKIITDESGRVWLRGVVNSQAEKDLIESKARHFAGTNNVTNELEVKESS